MNDFGERRKTARRELLEEARQKRAAQVRRYYILIFLAAFLLVVIGGLGFMYYRYPDQVKEKIMSVFRKEEIPISEGQSEIPVSQEQSEIPNPSSESSAAESGLSEAGSLEEALLRYDSVYIQAILIPENYDGILKDKILPLRNHIVEVYENDTKSYLQAQEQERKVKTEKASNNRYENDYENEDDEENCDNSYTVDSNYYEKGKHSKKVSDQKSKKSEESDSESKLLKYYIIYKMMHP